jgi:predicted porin
MLQAPAGNEIGFKGEEKLGGGLSAWFQCASTADYRGVSQAGWCSRNSALGFKGSFGNVWTGIWDTPFKRIGGTNLITSQTGIAGNTFLLVGGSTSVDSRDNPGLFFRRQRNTINYDSPTFSGFQLSLTTTSTNAATGATAGAAGAKPRLYSVGARYNNGPLNIGAAWDEHKNYYSVTSDTKDTAWLLTAGYLVGPVKLGAVYTRQKLEPVAGRNTDVNAWHLAAEWRISGPHGLRASYTQAGDTKGNGVAVAAHNATRPAPGNSTGARLWQARYVHTFSKRTEADFGYVKLNNDARAAYSLGGLSAPAAGTDQSSWFMTVTHRF